MWDISLRKDRYNSAEKICEEIIAKIFYINNKKKSSHKSRIPGYFKKKIKHKENLGILK